MCEKTIDVANSYLKGRSKDNFSVHYVSDSSMMPIFLPGDKVLFLKQNNVENGSLAVIELFDMLLLRKIKKHGKNYIAEPLNSDYETIYLKPKKLKVVGVPYLLMREFDCEV